jgi:type II secretory pathway pseudopilin PulG
VKPFAHGKARPGFLLVEALIGIAVFSIFLAGIGTTLLYGQENTIMAGDRIRATTASMRSLEAARAVRDGSFSSLAAGVYGAKIGSNGKWSLVPGTVTLTGSYVASVTLTASGADWMKVDALSKWKHGYARSGAVLLSTDVTNWRTTTTRADWRTLTVDGTFAPGGNVLFSRAAIGGSTLYVAAGNSVGLYVVNIANTASPTRIATSFSLGVVGYDVAVRGNRLYVVAADSAAELKVYNIANPNAPTLVTSVNLPGSSRARSLAITDRILLVGMTQSAVSGENELLAYNISSTGSSIPLVDSEDDAGDVLAIAVSGTGVYLASSQDSYELRAYRIYDSGSLAIASVPGYNLSDRTLDSQAIAVTGTSAILGSLRGSIQEMVMFNARPKVPSLTSTGPWYHEGSGSIVGAAMDPSRCVGFLAADSGRKALQVVHVRDTSSLTELTTHTSTTGKGRGVLYDPVRDRVFLLTDQAVVIFRGATSTGTCP